MTSEPSKCAEVKGRMIQISLKGIYTKHIKKERKTGRRKQIRKIVSNVPAKALSSLQTFKGLYHTLNNEGKDAGMINKTYPQKSMNKN